MPRVKSLIEIDRVVLKKKSKMEYVLSLQKDRQIDRQTPNKSDHKSSLAGQN